MPGLTSSFRARSYYFLPPSSHINTAAASTDLIRFTINLHSRSDVCLACMEDKMRISPIIISSEGNSVICHREATCAVARDNITFTSNRMAIMFTFRRHSRYTTGATRDLYEVRAFRISSPIGFADAGFCPVIKFPDLTTQIYRDNHYDRRQTRRSMMYSLPMALRLLCIFLRCC